MNQTPSLTSSINTYDPQNFSNQTLNTAQNNIQSSSPSGNLNTKSNSRGIKINSSSIYSGTFETLPKKARPSNLMVPILFTLIVFILALGLIIKFYIDSKKSTKY